MTDEFWKLEYAMPCPFCGGKNIKHGYLDDEGCESDNFYEMKRIYARCMGCGCSIVIDDNPGIYNEFYAKKVIIERWDDRKSMTPEEMVFWIEFIKVNRMSWVSDREAYNDMRLEFINKRTGLPATEEEIKEIREKIYRREMGDDYIGSTEEEK